MRERESEPDSVKELQPPSEAKARIEANARRASQLKKEREKEKRASAG